MKNIFCIFLALIFCAVSASQAAEPITITSGPKAGTYYVLARDLATILKADNMPVNVIVSEGSIDNIKFLNAHDDLALGIVQSDVLGFLSRSKNPDSQKLADKLQMIFPLYSEEVHILARKDIESVQQLNGKKVAIGEAGSGNMLTAVNIFSLLGITPSETVQMPSDEGIVEVLKDDIDAVIFVGGKPVKMFKNMEDLTKPENQKFALMLQNVHFLPLNEVKLYEEYEPAEITPADYRFVKSTIPTVAVQAVLVSLDSVEKNKKYCAQIGQFTRAVNVHLGELRAGGHPKWKEVDIESKSGIWRRSNCLTAF